MRSAVRGDDVRHGDDVAPGGDGVVHDDVGPCRSLEEVEEEHANEQGRNAKKHPQNQEVGGAVALAPIAPYDDVLAAVPAQGPPSLSYSVLARIPCPVRGPSLVLSRDPLSSSVPYLSSSASPSRLLCASPLHPILLCPKHWAHGQGGTHSYPYQDPSTIHSASRLLRPLHLEGQAQAISSAFHSSDHLSHWLHDGAPPRTKAKAHAHYRQHSHWPVTRNTDDAASAGAHHHHHRPARHRSSRDRLGTDRAAKPLENALHDLGNWDTACSLLTSLTKGVAEEVQVGVHRRRLDPELRTMTTNLSSVLRSLDVEDQHLAHMKTVASLYIRHTPSHAADVHEAEEDPSTKRRKEVVFVMDQGFH